MPQRLRSFCPEIQKGFSFLSSFPPHPFFSLLSSPCADAQERNSKIMVACYATYYTKSHSIFLTFHSTLSSKCRTGFSKKQTKEKSMKEQTPNQASGASETTRFFCTRISKGPTPDVPVLGGESRRVWDNAPILQLQMMLRTRFGLILKIMARTKSYKPLKHRYFIKQPDSQAKLSLFSGFHPNYFTPIISSE